MEKIIILIDLDNTLLDTDGELGDNKACEETPEERRERFHTEICQAIVDRDIKTYQRLRDCGVSVNASLEGKSLLYYSIKSDNSAIFHRLIADRALPDDDALLLAIDHENPIYAAILLHQGGKVNSDMESSNPVIQEILAIYQSRI
jgi:FMN phosphatase YigB (HAD superfamily)